MKNENMNNARMSELNDFGEEEFGGGSELTTIGFLVFGLLTFWIYTVWLYNNYLEKHISLRLEFFKSSLENNKNIPDTIIDKGFLLKRNPKYICIAFYSICMLIIVSRVIGILFGMFDSVNYETLLKIDMVSIGIASLLFCISSIYFIWWVSSTVKNHEYNELLMIKYIENPKNFKLFHPH